MERGKGWVCLTRRWCGGTNDGSMGRRAITQEFYDSLVEGFARHPGSAAAAARWAKCDPRTARRGWAVGWPHDGFKPVSEAIADRQTAARAVLSERAGDEREAARDAAHDLTIRARTDAAKERAQEGQIVRTAKHNALAVASTAAILAKRGFKLAQDLTDEELGALTVMQRLKALRDIAEFNRAVALTSEQAIKLERLVLGEPTNIEEHRHVHAVVASKDMADTIERASAALDRARKVGVVIDVEAIAAATVKT